VIPTEPRRRIVCEICGNGLQDGVSLYRANETGVTGIWRCSAHPNVESFTNEHDEETAAIERALEKSR
jgi:hypothetical protein